MTDDKKKPIFKVRCGGVSLSVFENSYKGKDNKPDFKVETISVQKSYLDKDDKWQNQTISLRKSDIIKLQICLQKVAEHQFLNKDDKEEA